MYFGNTIKSQLFISTIPIDLYFFSGNMYFDNTTNLNCRKKCKSIGIVESNNRDFIVLPKYIFTENYQGSRLLKANIQIIEEISTVEFYANNNLNFLIFLHNTNNSKSIKKSFFVRDSPFLLIFVTVFYVFFIFYACFWIESCRKHKCDTLTYKTQIIIRLKLLMS